MVQLCPRCQRANPDKAVFCHFDGCLLRQGGADGAAAGKLLQEFIFPSGRRCRTFDELAQGCYNEWEDARQLLKDGTFVSFLAGVGRADLARAGREAMSQGDPDIALTNFVTALPATGAKGPKLGLSPRKLVVGPVRVGEQRSVQVNLLNEGQGLLQGKVTVTEGESWLHLVDGDDHTCPVKTAREQPVALRADTQSLVVGQNYAGKLQVVTNGGVAEVPIRLDLVVRPFARAPYAGAGSPRDLARRMSKDPDPAVALLESGEVARWFASNGWAYPIAGTPAPGRASVQQFFEELGLAKPPPIALSEQEFRFRCTPGETVAGQVTLRTTARRIVYGRVESDSPWLRVQTPSVAGDFQAVVAFEVDSSQLDGDRLYQGNLKIIANAGQAFTIRVQVETQGKKGWFRSSRSAPTPSRSPETTPPPAPPPLPVPAVTQTWLPAPARSERETTSGVRGAESTPVAPPSGGLGQSILVAALLGLLLRLLLIFPADLFARLVRGGTEAGSLAAWLQAPAADATFLRLFVLATWWVGALAGAILVARAGGRVVDLLCGVLAGAVLGLAGCSTLGCLLVLGDELPRGLLRIVLGGREIRPALATPLWLLTALLCWVGLGAALGLVLGVMGRAGSAVLAALGRPLAGLLRFVGLGKAADFFALRGG
jgi:hypothetical protein